VQNIVLRFRIECIVQTYALAVSYNENAIKQKHFQEVVLI